MGRVTVRFGGILVLCAALFGATLLAAAENPQPEGSLGKVAPNANPTEAAEVVVNNRKIFEMRGNLLGYPPSERARRAEERIAEVLDQGGAGEVTTKMTAEGAAVFVNGALVFLITPGDVKTLAGVTLDSTVASVVGNLSKVIDETREGRDLRRALTALGKSVAATVLFGLLIWAVLRANRWLGARLSASIAARIDKLRVAGVTAVRPDQSLTFTRRVVTLIAWVVALVALHLWLTFVLQQFP